MPISRRNFLAASVVGVASLPAIAENTTGEQTKRAAKLPILICSEYSYNWIDDGYKMLSGGADTLDAAIQVVKGPEDDPNYQNVGLGGRPNEEGVVELDACCMHGPSRTAGAVGGVRAIKHVALF